MRFGRFHGPASLTTLAAIAFAAFWLLTASPALALTPHEAPSADTFICAACHSLHAATDAALLRAAAGPDRITATCVSCHAGTTSVASDVFSGEQNAFGLGSGHSLEPTVTGGAEIRGCGTCHDPHGASSEVRNIPAKRINDVSVTTAGIELCVSCHDAQNSWYGADYPSTALPARDATGYPTTGTWPGPATYSSEANPHRLIPESTQTVGVSEPVRRQQGDCLYCHASHRGPNAYDGLVQSFTVPTTSTLTADQAEGSYAALCLSCHGEAGASLLGTAVANIAQFATGSGTAGHRIETSGGLLPVGAPLPCFECHNPHGSQRGNASLISDERGASLATTDAPKVRAFCFTCHTTSDSGAGWDSDAATYTVVGDEQKVVGLSRTDGLLHLSSATGHAQSDAESCHECHGDSYATGGSNVHNPAPGPVLLLTLPASLSSELPTGSVDATSGLIVGSIDATASADSLGATAPAPAIEPTASASTDASATPESIVGSPSVDSTGPPPDNPLPVDPTVPLQPDTSFALTGTVGALALSRPRRRSSRDEHDEADPPAP